MITKSKEECTLTEEEHRLLEKVMNNPKFFKETIDKFNKNKLIQNFHRNALELNDAELYKLYGD